MKTQLDIVEKAKQLTSIPSDDGFGMTDVGEAKPSKYKVEEGENENEVIVE